MIITLVLPKLKTTINEIYDLLEEERYKKKTYTVKLDTILGLAEDGRLERSKDVEVVRLEESSPRRGIVRYDFEASSKEKTESDAHIGYIELVERSGNIHSMYCSCSDYQSRHHTYNVENHKIGDYDKGEEIGSMKEYFDPHNKAKPVVMNPDGEDGYALGMACKHILATLVKLQEIREE